MATAPDPAPSRQVEAPLPSPPLKETGVLEGLEAVLARIRSASDLALLVNALDRIEALEPSARRQTAERVIHHLTGIGIWKERNAEKPWYQRIRRCLETGAGEE